MIRIDFPRSKTEQTRARTRHAARPVSSSRRHKRRCSKSPDSTPIADTPTGLNVNPDLHDVRTTLTGSTSIYSCRVVALRARSAGVVAPRYSAMRTHAADEHVSTVQAPVSAARDALRPSRRRVTSTTITASLTSSLTRHVLGFRVGGCESETALRSSWYSGSSVPSASAAFPAAAAAALPRSMPSGDLRRSARPHSLHGPLRQARAAGSPRSGPATQARPRLKQPL